MPLPFATVRDLVCQHQQCFDQMVAKRQSSPLDGEQCKCAKTPPQADPDDIPIREHTQHGGHEDRDWAHSRTRGEVSENWTGCAAKAGLIARVTNVARAANVARVRNAPRVAGIATAGHTVSTKYGNQECGHPSGDGARARGRPEEDRSCWPLSTSSHSYEQTRNSGCTRHLAPSNDKLSKFLKLKEEVVKQPQNYIQGHAKLIAHTLAPDHEAVKCLVAFGENTLKYAAEVLATIECGTQHWKLQESFPVPLVPRWLHMPELM